MSLLQHPIRALDQVERYLNSSDDEEFPGAYLLAAGNLSRQVLEQVLFILAFYSRMPSKKFMKSSNELRTKGFVKAILDSGPENKPGVELTVIVSPKLLDFKDGRFHLKSPQIPITVVPDSREVPYRWTKRVVLVQHSSGMNLQIQMMTRSGRPIDLSDIGSVLKTFAADPKDRLQLAKRLKQLGIDVCWVKKAD